MNNRIVRSAWWPWQRPRSSDRDRPADGERYRCAADSQLVAGTDAAERHAGEERRGHAGVLAVLLSRPELRPLPRPQRRHGPQAADGQPRGESEEYAHWSPDGTRIAYTEWGRGGDSIWVRNADGSGKFHVVTRGVQSGAMGTSLSWSPDGKQILSARYVIKPFDGLSVVNADGSGRRVVPGAPCWPHFATWAPNGKIVFVRVRSDRAFRGGDLYAVNPDGSGLQRLTKGAWLTSPSVSPDGSTIAAYATKADRLIAMPFRGDGHAVTLLAHASQYFPEVGSGHYHPNVSGTPVIVSRWNSDGKKLVLGSDDSWGASQPQYTDPKAGAGLYIVNADGSGFTRVPGVTDAIDPDWRP